MAKAPKKPLRDWDVSLIGAIAKYIGRVKADSASSAIAKFG